MPAMPSLLLTGADHSCDEGAVALLIGVRASADPAPGRQIRERNSG